VSRSKASGAASSARRAPDSGDQLERQINATATSKDSPFQAFDWGAHLKVHPAAELFPRLPEDELKKLAEDVKANGLQVPPVVWRDEEKGTYSLIDGRNRLDAMVMAGLLTADTGEIGLVPEAIIQKSGDPYALALSLNIRRRHLSAEQTRDLIAQLLKAKPKESNRSIAKQTKTDHKTVGAVRKQKIATGEIPQLEKTVGADGRERPASKPSPKAFAKPTTTKSVAPGDTALAEFDAHVLELVRRVKKHPVRRFAKTALSADTLHLISAFFNNLAKLKDGSDPAASAENRKAENARPEAVS
jgi:hypothetical protein